MPPYDPGDNSGDSGGDGVFSIAYLKSLCGQYPITITGDTYIEGVVISTDYRGEFYKTLIVEDETGGIEIKLDREFLAQYFWIGSTVRVRCNALVVGNYNTHILQLGIPVDGNNTQIGRIPNEEIDGRIKTIADVTARHEPAKLTFATLSPRYVGCHVMFENVQFIEEDLSKNWCDDGIDSDRHLIDHSGNILTVRVSHKIDYASAKIEQGSGWVCGILSYFNNSYQLRMYDPIWLRFENPRF